MIFPLPFARSGRSTRLFRTPGAATARAGTPSRAQWWFSDDRRRHTLRGAYKIAPAKTEEFLARHPNARELLHQPEFYAAYFAELYSLLGPQAAKEDPAFAASEEFDFPKADEACQLVGESTRRVLVKWGDGIALAERLEREKHLTGDEGHRAQSHSISLYEGEFQAVRARGIVFQPTDDWNFFVWKSTYDDDLGACHAEGTDYVC